MSSYGNIKEEYPQFSIKISLPFSTISLHEVRIFFFTYFKTTYCKRLNVTVEKQFFSMNFLFWKTFLTKKNLIYIIYLNLTEVL